MSDNIFCNDCCCTGKTGVRDEERISAFSQKLFSSIRGLGYFINDVSAIIDKDPALKGSPLAIGEVILYASFWALLFHRIAHLLHTLHLPFIPRLISQIARFLTGIEIHPGAQIGPGLFIDHGNGVVIGETAILGKDILLYHGVTLGGVDSRKGRRHPRLEDSVIVGAGAKILGAITIGRNAKIGAQSVILVDIPENSTAVGIPARIIRQKCRQFA